MELHRRVLAKQWVRRLLLFEKPRIEDAADSRVAALVAGEEETEAVEEDEEGSVAEKGSVAEEAVVVVSVAGVGLRRDPLDLRRANTGHDEAQQSTEHISDHSTAQHRTCRSIFESIVLY